MKVLALLLIGFVVGSIVGLWPTWDGSAAASDAGRIGLGSGFVIGFVLRGWLRDGGKS